MARKTMETDASLQTIKAKLFHGLLDYTKSFPDFSIPQRFSMVSPREGKEVLNQIEQSLNGQEEILVYIHLPFCSSECVFCNAFPQKSSKDIQDRYVENILEEIEIYSSAQIFRETSVKCLYLGGGTPTSFSNDQIERILRKLRSAVTFSEDCSVTCEAHVKDLLGTDRIGKLAKIGVNRISIGCQTFDPRVLELCRRFHRASQVKEVIRDIRGMGLSTNIDMMIGLPGQSLEGVRRDLDVLDDIAPDSIEYMRHEIVNPLAISLFREDPDLLVDRDQLFEMAFRTQAWMEEKGYEQNGSFTSEKLFPYRYYWLKEMPFIALGSRSRSYTKDICFDKHEDLSLYFRLIERGVAPIARCMVLNETEQMYRSLFLNLQVRDGLDLKGFESRFGEDALQVFSSLLERLAEYGCLEVGDSSIRLSRYGRYFVEDICCSIIDQALHDGGYDADFKRMPHSSGAFSERRISRLRELEGG
jgi:oxygen-independent coproporphyrinogen-3 oxidase